MERLQSSSDLGLKAHFVGDRLLEIPRDIMKQVEVSKRRAVSETKINSRRLRGLFRFGVERKGLNKEVRYIPPDWMRTNKKMEERYNGAEAAAIAVFVHILGGQIEVRSKSTLCMLLSVHCVCSILTVTVA